MKEIVETEIFHLNQDVTFKGFLLFFQVHNEFSRFEGEGRRSQEEIQNRLNSGLPVITEWQYPKSLTVEQLSGPLRLRIVLLFKGLASRTVIVIAKSSVHAENLVGNVIKTIQRVRREKNVPVFREVLWRLKNELEGHAYDEILNHFVLADPLSRIDPPEGALQSVRDAEVWHHGMTLLEAASYFNVLREELGADAGHFAQLNEELQALGRLYLSVSSSEGITDTYLDTVKHTYLDNFARLAASEKPYDQDLVATMMIYFMSLHKNLTRFKQDFQGLHEQAKGNRGKMKDLLLEYSRLDIDEIARMAQGMPAGDTIVFFRGWAMRRQAGDNHSSSSLNSDTSAVKEIQLSCAWFDSDSLMKELAPHVGAAKLEVRNRGPRFRSSVDQAVLVAVLGAVGATVHALVTALIQWRAKMTPEGGGRVVIKVSTEGIEIDVPRDYSNEQIQELVAERVREFEQLRARNLDHPPNIYIE